MTRQVRHVYLTWSSEPHEGVGDAPVLTYVETMKKTVYNYPLVVVFAKPSNGA